MSGLLSIILPAHNEALWIGDCLEAILASDPLPEGWGLETIVVPNGCQDDTAGRSRAHGADFAARGWTLQVVELAAGGKLGALNRGDDLARGAVRVYLDADVRVSPPLLRQIAGALDTDLPRYASGTPHVAQARSLATRLYSRFWERLPFVTTDAPGFGIFAMNTAGRGRWKAWPDIISDDTFARLNFAPAERERLSAFYTWPLVEGFANLVRVRRRQNIGVREIAERFPQLEANALATRPGKRRLARLALTDPAGFLVYAAVSLAVKTPLYDDHSRWARGR
ncbi:glycosyltransferase family 2 protein [Pseudodonghicola flavimaris]|uniref:Glycosyltransferase n=1 Tax=Pseudodonghicola flavimaris TaxID=3050036 RepID=A0ABT7F3K2_9RHOB|nr:glycosyltransferase [Pseudodonghicola flavimaris]MDK3019176.1 glycosyltransferase [Pseudodonghicola flavimaris]